MTTQPLPLSLQSSSQLKLDKLLEALFSVSEVSYSRIFLKQYGFETSINADKTTEKIIEQFKNPSKLPEQCTLDNLAKIVKAMMLLGKHHCEVTLISKKDAKYIIENFDNFKFAETLFSNNFPILVDNALLKISGMPVITAVEKKPKGIVFYFSTVRRKTLNKQVKKEQDGKIKTMFYEEEIKVQYIDTVFMPFDRDRLEFRVSCDVQKRDIADQITRLKDAFFTFLEVNKLKIKNTSSVDINSAIENLYNKPDYGRVVETSFLSLENSIVMPRSCRKDVQVCLREQEYHKAGAEKEKVKCVGVSIRWVKTIQKVQLLIRSEIQLESLPSMDYTSCTRFVMENPSGLAQAIEWVDVILKARE